MFNASQITELSQADKVRAMEALWADMTAHAEDMESPAWHREELQKTARRYADGKEAPIDWTSAKHQLRKRIG